jgi:threonine dehydratase
MSTVISAAVDRPAIGAAFEVIRAHIRRTPILETSGADFGLGHCTLVFKLEMLQHAGAFKTRGAFANLLMRPLPPAGVVAASGGNHGTAVAFAAMRLGVPATIFIPRVASPAKIQRIRDYGADLRLSEGLYAEALAASQEWNSSAGALTVHAFDQRETLLGTGTIGLEIEEQTEPLDTLLVAVGGGGLIGGIAAWFGSAIDVIGVEPETAPTLTAALRAGRPVDAPAGGIAADSLAPKRVGELMFPIARKQVKQVLLVADDAIRRAQQVLWERLRVVAEPGAATPFSALLSGRYIPRAGERVGILISGANTDAVRFDS